MDAINGDTPVDGAAETNISSSSERDTLVVEEAAPGRRRITGEAKKELHDHFTGPPQYARNKRMPMANINAALDTIIKNHGISRAQASRQLRSWKMNTFEQANVSVTVSAEDVETRIKNSISVSTDDFV
jgi:hypothetical protein